MILGFPAGEMALLAAAVIGAGIVTGLLAGLLGVLLIAPASVFAAPYGARLAHRLSKRKLEVAFGLFLLFVAARFAASLLL